MAAPHPTAEDNTARAARIATATMAAIDAKAAKVKDEKAAPHSNLEVVPTGAVVTDGIAQGSRFSLGKMTNRIIGKSNTRKIAANKTEEKTDTDGEKDALHSTVEAVPTRGKVRVEEEKAEKAALHSTVEAIPARGTVRVE